MGRLIPGALPDHNADLRQAAQITDLIESTRQEHGGLNVLVNNAVVRYFGAVENFAPDHWDEALAVNLSAPFHAIRLALPAMKANGRGLIAFLCGPHGDDINRSALPIDGAWTAGRNQ
jgi:3-hydroxybutyrate dehydrogenase